MLPTLRCMECWKTGQRCESRYAFGLCEDNPVLCVDPCFRTFHLNLGFGEGYHEEGNGDDTVGDDRYFSIFYGLILHISVKYGGFIFSCIPRILIVFVNSPLHMGVYAIFYKEYKF